MIGRTNGGAKGGGGELHGASIQISTSEASLIGTVCQLKQNNTVIKTKVFNSGGVALFTDIQEVDTYTVVVTDGVDTATENVSVTASDIVNKTVLTITVSFSATITFDVYSAVNDTVYYIENGSPVTLCTTDSNGKASGVALTIPAHGKTLMLYSTIMDDPSNPSQKYSKSITFTTATTEIYLMNGKALYWGGYDLGNFKDITSGQQSSLVSLSPQAYNSSKQPITVNTNNIELKNTSTSNYYQSVAVSDNLSLSGYTKLFAFYEVVAQTYLMTTKRQRNDIFMVNDAYNLGLCGGVFNPTGPVATPQAITGYDMGDSPIDPTIPYSKTIAFDFSDLFTKGYSSARINFAHAIMYGKDTYDVKLKAVWLE